MVNLVPLLRSMSIEPSSWPSAKSVTNLRPRLSTVFRSKLSEIPTPLSETVNSIPFSLIDLRLNTISPSPSSVKAYFKQFAISSLTINPTGDDSLAHCGTGDVLTGLIGGLLAQGSSSRNAALLGCYIHGLAGELVNEEISCRSITATQVMDCFGFVFKDLEA